MKIGEIELSLLIIGIIIFIIALVGVIVYIYVKRKRSRARETERLLIEKSNNIFPTNGVGQTSQTFEEIRQIMNESSTMNSVGHLKPRSSFAGDYWPTKQRTYGSLTDSLSIARTESYKSRKASTDSGIAGSIGIGSVIPDLYQRRGTIIRRESSPTVTTCGTVYFKLLYLFKTSDLLVKIEHVSDIPASIHTLLPNNTSVNPFLTIEIEPTVDQKLRQTSLKHNDLNPKFGETFKFPVAYEELYAHGLIFSIFNFNDDSSKQKFGKSKMSLDAVDPSMEIDIWIDLIVTEPEKRETRGKLLLSLNYLPSAERLTVVIMKAKDLQFSNKLDDHHEYYVRVNQMLKDKIIKKKKTLIQSFKNLTWDEGMVFKLTKDILDDVTFEVKLIQKDNTSYETVLGDFTLGKKAYCSSGREHWSDIILGTKETFTMWHNLQKDM